MLQERKYEKLTKLYPEALVNEEFQAAVALIQQNPENMEEYVHFRVYPSSNIVRPFLT